MAIGYLKPRLEMIIQKQEEKWAKRKKRERIGTPSPSGRRSFVLYNYDKTKTVGITLEKYTSQHEIGVLKLYVNGKVKSWDVNVHIKKGTACTSTIQGLANVLHQEVTSTSVPDTDKRHYHIMNAKYRRLLGICKAIANKLVYQEYPKRVKYLASTVQEYAPVVFKKHPEEEVMKMTPIQVAWYGHMLRDVNQKFNAIDRAVMKSGIRHNKGVSKFVDYVIDLRYGERCTPENANILRGILKIFNKCPKQINILVNVMHIGMYKSLCRETPESFKKIWTENFGVCQRYSDLLHDTHRMKFRVDEVKAVEWAEQFNKLSFKNQVLSIEAIHDEESKKADAVRWEKEQEKLKKNLWDKVLIPGLEQYRMKIGMDLHHAGQECHNCIGGYSDRENMLFFRKANICCSVYYGCESMWGRSYAREDGKFYIDQCFDTCNKITDASQKFREEVEAQIQEVNNDRRTEESGVEACNRG